MRLNELFNKEDKQDFDPRPLPIELEELVKILKNNCGKMIEAYQQSGIVLLRGIGDIQGKTNTLAFTATIRKDRRSTVAPQDHHEQMSAALTALGLPSRKEVLATTPKMSVARQWGPTCVVFLKDGWEALSFQHGDIEDIFVKSDPILNRSGDNSAALQKIIQDTGPILAKGSGDLAILLKGRHEEISLKGTQYWAIPTKLVEDVLEELNVKATNL